MFFFFFMNFRFLKKLNASVFRFLNKQLFWWLYRRCCLSVQYFMSVYNEYWPVTWLYLLIGCSGDYTGVGSVLSVLPHYLLILTQNIQLGWGNNWIGIMNRGCVFNIQYRRWLGPWRTSSLSSCPNTNIFQVITIYSYFTGKLREIFFNEGSMHQFGLATLRVSGQIGRVIPRLSKFRT